MAPSMMADPPGGSPSCWGHHGTAARTRTQHDAEVQGSRRARHRLQGGRDTPLGRCSPGTHSCWSSARPLNREEGR